MCNAKSKLEAPIHPSSLGLKNEKGSPPETICEGQPIGFLKLGSYAGTLQRKQCNRRQQCQELCRDTTEETVQQETTVSGAMPGHYRGNSATGDNSVRSYAGTLQRKQCNRRQQCQELCRDTTEETVQQETTVSGAMPGHYRGNSATGDNSVRSYAGTLQRKQCNS